MKQSRNKNKIENLLTINIRILVVGFSNYHPFLLIANNIDQIGCLEASKLVAYFVL